MVPPDDVKTGYRGNRPRMGGDRNLKPGGDGKPPALAGASLPTPRSALSTPVAAKKRVLFVCIGNSCRSQMAEAFARAYGSDVLVAQSAGLSPAAIIQPLTTQVLAERNVKVDGQFPKGLEIAGREPFDLVINMSGQPVNLPKSRVVAWPVRDPIGESDTVYRNVAQQIEGLVMGLILSLRNGRMP
jgi:arsenate reductase